MWKQSLLQSSVWHDPSEIILIVYFGAQETFPIIINAENSFAAVHFCGKHDFFHESFMKKKANKNNILFEIFCNISNVFTVILMHDRNTHFLKKILINV